MRSGSFSVNIKRYNDISLLIDSIAKVINATTSKEVKVSPKMDKYIQFIALMIRHQKFHDPKNKSHKIPI